MGIGRKRPVSNGREANLCEFILLGRVHRSSECSPQTLLRTGLPQDSHTGATSAPPAEAGALQVLRQGVLAEQVPSDSPELLLFAGVPASA